jgi:hypothetical protein
VKYLIPLLFLAGCAHVTPAPEPIVAPVEVVKPIAGGCVPETLGPAPDYADTKDTLKAAKDAAERYQLLWAGRAQREARLNELEPVVAGCPRGSSK